MPFPLEMKKYMELELGKKKNDRMTQPYSVKIYNLVSHNYAFYSNLVNKNSSLLSTNLKEG